RDAFVEWSAGDRWMFLAEAAADAGRAVAIGGIESDPEREAALGPDAGAGAGDMGLVEALPHLAGGEDIELDFARAVAVIGRDHHDLLHTLQGRPASVIGAGAGEPAVAGRPDIGPLEHAVAAQMPDRPPSLGAILDLVAELRQQRLAAREQLLPGALGRRQSQIKRDHGCDFPQREYHIRTPT